jgi:antitoxin HigA-1
MRSLRDPRRAPTHPGAVLREDVLPSLGMSQTDLAKRLDVSRVTVSDLLHERRALTPEMAARLARLLRGVPEIWLRMQAARDLWEIQRDPERLAGVQPVDKRLLRAA